MTTFKESPDHALPAARGERRSEQEIIAGRIASARHWHRRHAVLSLRARLFGRRKREGAGPRRAGARPAAVRTI